jgi:hypothetical protein
VLLRPQIVENRSLMDAARGTAASALARLLRCCPELLPVFEGRAGVPFLREGTHMEAAHPC